MQDDDQKKQQVDRFLRDQIDTVPHLEALLLIWNNRPRTWSVEEMAKGLFVSSDAAAAILDDLVRQRLIVRLSGAHCYESEPQQDLLLESVDSFYRRELIRVSRLIHSKPSAAIREFARAFRLKKDSE